MIFCSATNSVIGTIGWVDGGSLWSFDVDTQIEDRIEIADAAYLSLSPGQHGLFRLVHHQSPTPEVSIRRLAEPAKALASVQIHEREPIFTGDVTLWNYVEPTFISFSADHTSLSYIDGEQRKVFDLDLSWFNADSYDLGYQGLTGAMTLKDAGLVVVSVQRSSTLVLIDLFRNKVGGQIQLANRGGNPKLLRHSAKQFLASDYDTICSVDIESRKLMRAVRLQPSEPPYTQLFIGDYDLSETNAVIVARPFSGDALKLDAELAVSDQVAVTGQPLAICTISNNRFLTRDWKTGKVETGTFSHSP